MTTTTETTMTTTTETETAETIEVETAGREMTARNLARIAGMKSLRYGIELEIVGIGETTALRAIAAAVPGSTDNGYEVVLADGRKWKAVHDGSLHHSSGRTCEVVSPILTWADMDTVQTIVRALRAAGGRVNESCGMHVHVDGAQFKATP